MRRIPLIFLFELSEVLAAQRKLLKQPVVPTEVSKPILKDFMCFQKLIQTIKQSISTFHGGILFIYAPQSII
jgi:hypothetical protein